jgi:hypothetical protein
VGGTVAKAKNFVRRKKVRLYMTDVIFIFVKLLGYLWKIQCFVNVIYVLVCKVPHVLDSTLDSDFCISWMLVTEVVLSLRKMNNALCCHLTSFCCCQDRRERANPRQSGQGAVLCPSMSAPCGLSHLPVYDLPDNFARQHCGGFAHRSNT